MKRWVWITGWIFVILAGSSVVWSSARSAPVNESPSSFLLQIDDKPIYNWHVCADLGIGNVPGLPDPRQRFRLCHNRGWAVLTYCLQPSRPAPAIGATCSRVTEDTYWCGNGIQNLREYRVVETPTATPTATSTPTATATFTPTPTNTATLVPTTTATSSPTTTITPASPALTVTPAAPTRQPLATIRARPGGLGNVDLQAVLNLLGQKLPTRTPFSPYSPTLTPFQPMPPTPVVATPTITPAFRPVENPFARLSFREGAKRIYIHIFPTSHRVNEGKPIIISFIPGDSCVYGDHRGCINQYTTSIQDAPVTFISVHSGVGGEGQAFRDAVEGTGLNQAGFSLQEVKSNLAALAGADVVIRQGKLRLRGLRLTGTMRVPAGAVDEYFLTPIDQALGFAFSKTSWLTPWFAADQAQIVFETCGWKMPGEPWAPGLSSTTASIYLGVIQAAP